MALAEGVSVRTIRDDWRAGSRPARTQQGGTFPGLSTSSGGSRLLMTRPPTVPKDSTVPLRSGLVTRGTDGRRSPMATTRTGPGTARTPPRVYRMLTYQEAAARFVYNRDTGSLTWKNGPRKGKPAGSKWQHGRRVRPGGRGSKAITVSHLAYLLVVGRPLPEGWVIHRRNGDRFDDRWENLQPLHRARFGRNGVTDRVGIHRSQSGRWVASIRTGNPRRHHGLGTFATLTEAQEARTYAVEWLESGNAWPPISTGEQLLAAIVCQCATPGHPPRCWWCATVDPHGATRLTKIQPNSTYPAEPWFCRACLTAVNSRAAILFPLALARKLLGPQRYGDGPERPAYGTARRAAAGGGRTGGGLETHTPPLALVSDGRRVSGG